MSTATAPNETSRTTTRNREWVRLHVLEGRTTEEIGAASGVTASRVRQVLGSEPMRKVQDELIAEHARMVRGKVAAMATKAAAVMVDHLDGGDEVPEHVRSKAALFVLEKVGFPDVPDTLNVTIHANPQADFSTWLGKLPTRGDSPEPTPMPESIRSRLNGNGYSPSAG